VLREFAPAASGGARVGEHLHGAPAWIQYGRATRALPYSALIERRYRRSKALISEITGEVLYDRIQRHSLLVRVNSLCYEILVPSGIAARLRQAPESERPNPVTLYTIYYIDGAVGGGHLTPKLVGFLDPLDREFFEVFTTVPGVGFMKALKCLVRPLNEIALAIERGDAAFLEELPYVGKKTAERIITELRGKMAKFALAHSEAPLAIERESAAELKAEAVQVLIQLEYSRSEAQRIVEETFAKHKNVKTVEEFLRKVFEQRQSAAEQL
jgi:Holliday junction DNA helicase RuvA